MKKITAQLKTLSKSLDTISKKVEKIIQDVDKLKAPKKAAPAKKTAAKKTVAKKTAAKKTVSKKAAAKTAAPAQQATMLNSVFDIIKRTKKGVTVAQLKDKTQLNARQLSNALYKLTKKGKIQTKSRGLYVKK
jgi:predicted Rossmann fold nucleotide-binding protein DprA/Smf involved in DNA uptake